MMKMALKSRGLGLYEFLSKPTRYLGIAPPFVTQYSPSTTSEHGEFGDQAGAHLARRRASMNMPKAGAGTAVEVPECSYSGSLSARECRSESCPRRVHSEPSASSSRYRPPLVRDPTKNPTTTASLSSSSEDAGRSSVERSAAFRSGGSASWGAFTLREGASPRRPPAPQRGPRGNALVIPQR